MFVFWNTARKCHPLSAWSKKKLVRASWQFKKEKEISDRQRRKSHSTKHHVWTKPTFTKTLLVNKLVLQTKVKNKPEAEETLNVNGNNPRTWVTEGGAARISRHLRAQVRYFKCRRAVCALIIEATRSFFPGTSAPHWNKNISTFQNAASVGEGRCD